MSVCTTHMIGIQEGGKVKYSMQRKDMLKILSKLDMSLDIERIAWSLSSRLGGGKGDLWVIGGIFNHMGIDAGRDFACDLSGKLETEVMIMSWHENGDYDCAIFAEGRLLAKHNTLGNFEGEYKDYE